MGGVRTALYCWLFARKYQGRFILRIEDTDRTRFVPGAEDYIREALDWCGIRPDEGAEVGGEYGPYRQSERKDMYGAYAHRLIEAGHAYYAFDTAEELGQWREDMKRQGNPSPKYDAVTRQYLKNSLTLPDDEVQRRLDAGDPHVVRFKMPRNEEVRFEDDIRGWVQFQTSQLDDKVLLKADGMPTYHLANVVDDHLMEITHVIRGEEWLPSTPLHVMMYTAFGWDAPSFAHLPLILKPDGKGKLSKRDGDRLGFPVFPLDWTDPTTGERSVGYRERGFLPEAFVNMLAFLGWNPGTDQEIFSLDDLVEAFSIERVGKAGAKFDYDKAKWFNQQYVKSLDNATLVERTRHFFSEAGIDTTDADMETICGLIKERATFLHEFPQAGHYFFAPPAFDDPKEQKTIRKKWRPERRPDFESLRDQLNALPGFHANAIEETVKDFMTAHDLGFGQVLPILRIAMTGTMQGPPIFDVMATLGQETCSQRLVRAMDEFNEIAR